MVYGCEAWQTNRCPRRMTTSASIAGSGEGGEGRGERDMKFRADCTLTHCAYAPLATSVSLYGLSRMQNAFRMHCECASFDLNSCTLCYNIYGTHKIRKYAKNKRNYTGQGGRGGFIASSPQLMRYNYIYVYGSTQYINIFLAL